jgi:site-specific DNA recombinase
MLLALDLRLVIEDDRIVASFCKERLLKLIDPQANWNSSSLRMTIPIPASLQRRGQEHKLRLDPTGEHGNLDPKLIALVMRGHAAREQLAALDMTAPRDLRRELARVARIAYLAPDIVAAIVEGRQAAGLRSRKLERGELPLCWKAQREMLGFQ